MENLHVDALVVGGGIAGMQAALDLGDQGFQVALVEREPSIGGKMITLSKVFPTLDCCSCITTPKMSAVAHHPNIQLFTYCEVQEVDEKSAGFDVAVLQKPRYVDAEKCTGCRLCEYECPITVASSFDRDLGSYRAIRVPFSTAVPQTAVLDIENCLVCGKCEKVCPVEAVDFTQQPEVFNIEATSLVLATGFELTDLGAKKAPGRSSGTRRSASRTSWHSRAGRQVPRTALRRTTAARRHRTSLGHGASGDALRRADLSARPGDDQRGT